MKIWKLADKYELEYVKTEISSHLSADWPSDLSEWYNLDACFEAWSFRGMCFLRTPWPEDLLPDPVSAAILAKEAKIKGVLTAIYYDMYRAKRRIDWDKRQSEFVEDPCFKKGARWNLAITEQLLNLSRIQDVIEQLLHAYLPMMFGDEDEHEVQDEEGPQCTTPKKCQPLLQNKRNEVTQKLWKSRDPLAVLHKLDRWSEESGHDTDVCGR